MDITSNRWSTNQGIAHRQSAIPRSFIKLSIAATGQNPA